ncbi:MAG: AcrVA2 family anti-CRISPR protein [Eubacteriales bacterium]
MKQQKPLPIVILDYVNALFGRSLWDRIEAYRSDHSGQWDERCYIPITHITEVLCDNYPADFMRMAVQRTNAGTLAALAGWRRCKEIYHFDPDFARLIMEDADENALIPYDALASLPYNCLYIDAPVPDFDGFFVYYEQDAKTGGMELRMDAVKSSEPTYATGISLHLVGKTVADGIAESIRYAKKSYQTIVDAVGARQAEAARREFERISGQFVPAAIQLILYLCAENAEIAENPEQKQITRRTPQIKDQFREIRSWDVGQRYGVRIRKFRSSRRGSSDKGPGTGTHASPSPHMRRAHWHHFWVGKRDSDERQLVLRWLPPIFVAGDDDAEDTIPTVNKIENKNRQEP